MLYLTLKFTVTAALVVAASELGRRSSWAAALLAALPLTSLLAFMWLHVEGASNAQIAQMSSQIFWLVIASLSLFLILPYLLSRDWSFWAALLVSAGGTACIYALTAWLLRALSGSSTPA
jgi:hypothetical protein